MSETLWVGLLGACAGMITAYLTQSLAARQANRQADRSERQEELRWQRTEASRLESVQREETRNAVAWERSEAQRKQTLQDARLSELWAHVLTARWQVLDALDHLRVQGRPAPKSSTVSAAQLPANAAGQAYSVALLGLASVRPSAKAFYEATARIQTAMLPVDAEAAAVAAAADGWYESFEALERAVAALADGAGEVKS